MEESAPAISAEFMATWHAHHVGGGAVVIKADGAGTGVGFGRVFGFGDACVDAYFGLDLGFISHVGFKESFFGPFVLSEEWGRGGGGDVQDVGGFRYATFH